MARVNNDIVTMTIQPADLLDRPGPTYRALADALADAIGGGRLASGARLPPQRELAHRLDVTVGTVGRAYDLLAQRGLTRGEVGRGTYVLPRTEPLRVADSGAGEVDGLIDLTSNFPAPVAAQASLGDLLPMQEAAVELMADLLRYPDAAGAMRHRVERRRGWGSWASPPSPSGSSSPTVRRVLWPPSSWRWLARATRC